jgi:ABC-type multidrug transport system fused ATPase/permease subunit
MSKPKAFLDQESSFRGHYAPTVFETLGFAYRPILVPILALILLGIAGRFFLLSNANIIGAWVDSYCRAPAICRPQSDLFLNFSNSDYLALLVVLTLSGFAMTAFYRIFFSRLSAQAVSRLYDEVTLRTSRLPIRFFDHHPVGRIVTRFSSDYGNVFRLFGGPLAEFLTIMFDIASMIVLMTIASPYYLPILVFIGVLNWAVYRLNRETIRRERRELSASRSPSIAHFAETAQGASTIRIFARQREFFRRFAQLNDRFLGQRIQTSVVVLKFSMQMGLMTALLMLVTGVAGYYLAVAGLVSIGSIGIAFTFIVLSGSSMQMFFEWMAQFEEAMTGVERLDEYLRRELEPGLKLPANRIFPTMHPVYAQGEEEELRARKLVSAASADLHFQDLWFRYDPELPFVLKGLDLHIRAGEKIGIVGRTGSGKSSLVQALFHLYPIERGTIRINGQDAHSIDLSLYRRSIALISQEPTLFRGTVRENLDLAEQYEDRSLIDALERVGLGGWLKGQPLGLLASIEERGRNLSLGERQLLCMARCLLQDAPIVVMDEATSSVDPQSEEILVRATREFFADRTQIIIAHRLSTLEHCDRILWLHKGEVKLIDRPEVVLPIFKQANLSVQAL